MVIAEEHATETEAAGGSEVGLESLRGISAPGWIPGSCAFADVSGLLQLLLTVMRLDDYRIYFQSLS